MHLNDLQPASGSKKNRHRVGRNGKWGKTCGRGHKGQSSRSGSSIGAGFEGGQMPLHRRMAKSGFRSAKARLTESVHVREIEHLGLKEISTKSLKEAGIIRSHKKFIRLYGLANKPLKASLSVPAAKSTRESLQQHAEKPQD